MSDTGPLVLCFFVFFFVNRFSNFYIILQQILKYLFVRKNLPLPLILNCINEPRHEKTCLKPYLTTKA